LLLWAAAIPAARKDAVMRVQTILFTKFLHICVVMNTTKPAGRNGAAEGPNCA
jgi:hypothetical protein